MAPKTSTRVNPKSVTILAMGGTTKQYIESREPGHRITKHVWAINEAGTWLDDVDLIIAMDDFRRDEKIDAEYVRKLMETGKPILACTVYEEYPTLQEYPLKAVLDCLDINPGELHPLDNSCNYALAYAMYKGMNEIHLVGYEFRPQYTLNQLFKAQKYAEEKYGDDVPDWFKFYMRDYMPQAGEPGEVGCCYLLGMCKERNIDVALAMGTTLMNAHWPRFYYGYTIQPKFEE